MLPVISLPPLKSGGVQVMVISVRSTSEVTGFPGACGTSIKNIKLNIKLSNITREEMEDISHAFIDASHHHNRIGSAVSLRRIICDLSYKCLITQ